MVRMWLEYLVCQANTKVVINGEFKKVPYNHRIYRGNIFKFSDPLRSLFFHKLASYIANMCNRENHKLLSKARA